jgi:pimeloyl-ACP methyl ester carboxylesterase
MGLTTLFLPGMHGTSRLFDRLLSELPDGLTPRVVSYPTDEVLGYDQLLERIELPNEPFAIVAESYSGPLAIRLAARGPANLRGLILVATFARSPRPIVPRWAAKLVRPWLFRLPLPQVGLRRVLLGDDAPRDQIAEVCREQRRCRPDVSAARVRDVLTVDVRDDLRQVSVPILYLGGTRDRVVPARAAQELKGIRPDIEQFFLDSPHAVLQRRPNESAALIVWFLLEKASSSNSQK